MEQVFAKLCLLIRCLLYLNMCSAYADIFIMIMQGSSYVRIVFSLKSFMLPVIIRCVISIGFFALFLMPLLLLHCICIQDAYAFDTQIPAHIISSQELHLFGISKTRYALWRGLIPFFVRCCKNCPYTFFCRLHFSPLFPQFDWFAPHRSYTNLHTEGAHLKER